MPQEPLVIEDIPGPKDGQRLLRLTGLLTMSTLFDFQSRVRTDSSRVLMLDFTNVPYVDSAGIGALVGGGRPWRCRTTGGARAYLVFLMQTDFHPRYFVVGRRVVCVAGVARVACVVAGDSAAAFDLDPAFALAFNLPLTPPSFSLSALASESPATTQTDLTTSAAESVTLASCRSQRYSTVEAILHCTCRGDGPMPSNGASRLRRAPSA
jgi:hypothetical protein